MLREPRSCDEISANTTLIELIEADPAEIVFVFSELVCVFINVIEFAVKELIVADAAEIEFVNVEGVLIAPDNSTDVKLTLLLSPGPCVISNVVGL